MKNENFDYQGKRKDQVESSGKAFAFSLFMLCWIVLIALTCSCISPNYVNGDQRKRVKESLKQSYPERETRPHEKLVWKFQ